MRKLLLIIMVLSLTTPLRSWEISSFSEPAVFPGGVIRIDPGDFEDFAEARLEASAKFAFHVFILPYGSVLMSISPQIQLLLNLGEDMVVQVAMSNEREEFSWKHSWTTAGDRWIRVELVSSAEGGVVTLDKQWSVTTLSIESIAVSGDMEFFLTQLAEDHGENAFWDSIADSRSASAISQESLIWHRLPVNTDLSSRWQGKGFKLPAILDPSREPGGSFVRLIYRNDSERAFLSRPASASFDLPDEPQE
jgi:hypothetical protein